MIHEPSLFDDPAAAMASVEANAIPEWITEADRIIRNLVPGTRFIGEQIVERVKKNGFVTHDLRAMGPVMMRLAREGVIVKTEEFRAAKSSHGSPKPVWKVPIPQEQP